MTAKEKAKELVLKYEKYLFNKFTIDDDWVKCIGCALIAIDELLHYSKQHGFIGLTEFYEEVKTEIEKL